MERNVTSGYLIVKTFERMYREYLAVREIRTFPLPDDRVIYSIPWKGCPAHSQTKRYQGASRDALFRWDDQDEKFFRGTNTVEEPEDDELEAHFALGRLPKTAEDEMSIIDTLEDARSVFSLLGAPRERELIWVRNLDSDSSKEPGYPLLGYEPTIGFGGACFSAISDCLCFPLWHGTDFEGALFKEHHARLNEYALFESPTAARDFIHYYLSFNWTEHGHYIITEVRSAQAAIGVSPPVALSKRGD